MASTEVTAVLKAFIISVTSSRSNEICQRYQELINVIRDPESGFAETLVKGIIKYMILGLGHYTVRKTRNTSLSFIDFLCKHYPCTVVKYFLDASKDYCTGSCTWSAEGVDWLSWSSRMTVLASKQELTTLINYQAFVHYGVSKSDRVTVQQGAQSIWKKLLGKNTELLCQYVDVLLASESIIYAIPLMASVLTLIPADHSRLEKTQVSFIEMCSKALFASKDVPSDHVLRSCSPIISGCSHTQYAETIMPLMKRSMLRNPELASFSATPMVNHASLDLSRYAVDISKLLSVELRAKVTERRKQAIYTYKCLASHCSDAGAVTDTVKHLFAVLNGSDGKVTVPAERMDVLTAIGDMSNNMVAGALSKQTTAEEAMKLFIPLLKQELHESTIVHALLMLSKWMKSGSLKVPKDLTNRIEIGVGPKNTSAVVRLAYLELLAKCYTTVDLLQDVKGLAAIFTATMDQAHNQPAQVPFVSEAAISALMMLKLRRADILEDEKVASLWKITLNKEKFIFSSDKFLQSAGEGTLMALTSLSELLIQDFPEKLNESTTELYLYMIVYTAAHHSYTVRKAGQSAAKKIVSGLGGHSLALVLIRLLNKLLDKQDWVQYFDEGSEEERIFSLSAKGFAEAVLVFTSLPSSDNRECTTVALAALLPAHHKAVLTFEPAAWLKIVSRFKLSPVALVRDSAEIIVKIISETDTITEAHRKCLQDVLRQDCPAIMSHVQQLCEKILSYEELKEITLEEFCIFQWPEGKLYDTSVIEKNKENDDMRNMKRENRLYSYQEQLMEMELKKEIEAKKIAEGKMVVKLNKKQQEAQDTQLKLESEIRSRVAKLDCIIQKCAALLLAVCESNASGLSTSLPLVSEMIIPALSYPLPAAYLYKVLIEINKASIDDKNLGQLVGVCSLRILEAACQVPTEWTQESVETQTARVLEQLAVGAPHSAAAFTCFYPLLDKCLNNRLLDQDQTLSVLTMIRQHAQLRSDLDTDGPALLPRCTMLKSLLKMIIDAPRKIAQGASEVLLAVCRSANGGDGCTVAEDDEVEVLLNALTKSSTAVRNSTLQGLTLLEDVLPVPDVNLELGNFLVRRLWIAKYDVDELNVKLASKLWDDLGLELDPALTIEFMDDITHDVECIRQASSAALTVVLDKNRDYLSTVIQHLTHTYEEKLYMPPPVLDNFGRVIQAQAEDMWRARAGIAQLMNKMAPFYTSDEVEELINFFIPNALHDRNATVAVAMREAAVAVVERHGKNNVNLLLPIFENTLASIPSTADYDTVKQGVVILMGNLAKHLDKSDPRVKPIVAKLIASLSTPSQQVQDAVANCLPPLVPAIKDEVPSIVQQLMQLLLSSDNFGERKGAAYGLAGLVKGSGILALKQLDIMDTLTEAVKNKKSPKEREGALFAFEMLCLMLGRLFEPYVVHVLPHLLLCFGDGNIHVRTAADDTARAVMSKLSAHGVKLVLPILLTALEEDQWRTKCGSVELLGAMAFCAPKQLSACLPQIVPKLTAVLADSHSKVQKAGATALQHIGEVIKNPEIQSIVPILLDALQDPNHKTTKCLQTLLDTQFVHFIDSPSLALIMPVVDRAIEDRATDTRKMACQIIGNMYSLTDQKDLAPYLPSIMPGLKKSLVDPVPEVRGMSARALGAMVRGIGEQGYEDLHPWLMETLTSDGNTVNRSGAAQGLSEVIGALGVTKLQKYVDEIVETASRPDIAPHVRDGYIMMFIYLPTVFGDEFKQFVGPITPTILKALADESEYVRDTGLRAGQRIINQYAETAIELLLPELENGLFDENWRIRYSSVQLLGDLLYKLSGVSGKMSTQTAHEDDNFGTELSQQIIIQQLGPERRNRVLSGLYMGRSDTALLVRQASLHVWKVIVSNTPKTLRDILPTLFSLLLGCLASQSYDKREIAARTLGDVVKKLGERVLPEIMPILEAGLNSEEADTRQGVCIGLSEIMKSTSREHVIIFVDSLVPTVSRALSDSHAPVREAASQTFDALHNNIGTRALDDILPKLLAKLDDEDQKEFALDGLTQVMSVKSQAVLPYLVPRLTQKPVNTKALSFLASVAGPALDRDLHKILQAMVASLSMKLRTCEEQEELGFASSVILSVQTDVGVRTVIDETLKLFSDADPRMQAASACILTVFCRDTRMEYNDYLGQLFRATIGLLTSTDDVVLISTWECLNACIKRLDSSQSMMQVPVVRQSLRYATSDMSPGDLLPGFCIPKKGITCLLQIFREGLLTGSPDLKESSAMGLAEAINRTSADALKQSVVHITGPLIRVLGDRYGSSVRVATLDTITVLLTKCGAMLKPFLPQLQTTFLKALNDSARSVRIKAAEAMGQLVIIHIRVDPLFTELNNNIKNQTTEDSSVRETFLHAMRLCLPGGGKRMNAGTRQDILKTLLSNMSHNEDVIRTGAASCLGVICGVLPEDELTDTVINHVLNVQDSNWMVLHARSVALSVAVKESLDELMAGETHKESLIGALLTHAQSDRVPIAQFGYRGITFLLRHNVAKGEPLDKRLVLIVGKGMKNDSNDIKQLVGQVIESVCRVANQGSGLGETYGKLWLPALISGTKEKNSAVRAFSEYALITLLCLRKDESKFKKYLDILDAGKKETLSDVVTKQLKKLIKQAEPAEENLDVTLLK